MHVQCGATEDVPSPLTGNGRLGGFVLGRDERSIYSCKLHDYILYRRSAYALIIHTLLTAL